MPHSQFQMLRCATSGVEAVVASTARTLAKHTHEQFGIGAMREGAHRSHSGRGQVEAIAGDLITVNAGEVHDGAPIGDHGRAWSMLYMEPALVHSAAEDAFAAHSGQFEFNRPVMSDTRVTAAFWQLFHAETEGDDALRREELTLALISLAGRFVTRPAESRPSPISSAKQRIDEDPAAAVTLTELAALEGLSRFQLVRSFARETGLTPHAYIVQRRIDIARRLIGSGHTLAGAAASAGFADQSHMTRKFVGRYGVSPGAYAAAVR